MVTRDTLEVDLPGDTNAVRVHALHVLDGSQAGLIFVLEAEETLAGRGESCQLALGEAGVSRDHAAFIRSSAGVTVMDLGSRNGTFVNGERVTAGVLVHHGDTVALGGVRLRYGLETEDQVRRLRELHQAAVLDHLTSLYNRRFLEQRLLAEVAYAARHSAPLSLLMFDVDRFKLLNDTHGHAAGDAALRAVARVLQRGVRTEDMVARYGGEEFVVVARGSGLDGALALAERLRGRVQDLVVDHEGTPLSVTVSVGAATLIGSLRDARQLLQAADGALFDAKAGGRNQVVAAAVDRSIVTTCEIDAVRPSYEDASGGDGSS